MDTDDLSSVVPPAEPSALERQLAPTDELVGRDGELSALSALFDRGARLVTLWGPAGIGKTRLAREYGARRAGQVVFVDLTQVSHPREVLARLALRVGMGNGSDLPSLAMVLDHMEAPLLIFDNFEHVMDAAAPVVGELLSRVTGLRCLATSRERLLLSDERPLALSGLALTLADDSDSEATRLFKLRARKLVPDFEVGADQTDALAELVRRLGGVPLAIELAAARTDLMDVPALLARMDRPLDVLKSRARDGVPRQLSMRGALDWSWQLLTDQERLDLIACTVFRGNFSLAGVEAVLAAVPAHGDPLERIQSLRDKSLVAADGAGLRMPHALRVFVLEQKPQMPAEVLVALQQAHADHYQGLADDHLPQGTPLSSELSSNLHAVAEQQVAGLNDGQLARVVRAIVALAATLKAGGVSPALDLVITHILTRRAGHISASDQGRLLALHAHQLSLAGQVNLAMTELQRAGELVDEPQLAAEITTDLGVLLHGRRDLDGAARCYGQALTLLGPDGSASLRARVVGDLGAVHHDRREFDVAQAHYQDALQLLGSGPDRRLEGVMRGNLGVLEQEQGNRDAAIAQYARAVDLLAQVAEPRLEAIALGNLGSLHHEGGELERARDHYLRALHSLTPLGDVRSEVLARVRLSAAQAALGDTTSAELELKAADRLCLQWGDPMATALVDLARGFLDGALAAAANAAGASEEAAEHLQRAGARIELHRHPVSQGAHVDGSDDLRWLLRLLGRFVTPLGLKLEELSEDALVVAADARFVRPPHESWHDLRRHHVLRRMLTALVTRHAAAPGSGLTLEALQAAAWPSERIRPDAAANRVYVAIAKLRKSGLKPHLQRDEGGYFLDPKLKVVRGEPLSS